MLASRATLLTLALPGLVGLSACDQTASGGGTVAPARTAIASAAVNARGHAYDRPTRISGGRMPIRKGPPLKTKRKKPPRPKPPAAGGAGGAAGTPSGAPSAAPSGGTSTAPPTPFPPNYDPSPPVGVEL